MISLQAFFRESEPEYYLNFFSQTVITITPCLEFAACLLISNGQFMAGAHDLAPLRQGQYDSTIPLARFSESMSRLSAATECNTDSRRDSILHLQIRTDFREHSQSYLFAQ